MATKKEAKPANPGLDFVKFIKDIYKEETQFNFADGFELSRKDGRNFISFPGWKSAFAVNGVIDLSESGGFFGWFSQKDGSVYFDNNTIDELRKTKISSFKDTIISDDEFTIVTLAEDGSDIKRTFSRKSEIPEIVMIDNAEYSIDVPSENLLEPVLAIYTSKTIPGQLTFNKDDAKTTVVDIPVKSLEVIMKKDASYSVSVGFAEKDKSNSRLVCFKANSKRLELDQVFRVVEF
jgi:hypothetical protein